MLILILDEFIRAQLTLKENHNDENYETYDIQL